MSEALLATSAPRLPRRRTSAGGRTAIAIERYHHIAQRTRVQMIVVTGRICHEMVLACWLEVSRVEGPACP